MVADALNCQKETAKAAIRTGADYLFSVKDNQETLKYDIKTYVQDKDFRTMMDTATKTEVCGDRKETRRAYSSAAIDWMQKKVTLDNRRVVHL